jgi:hypothetical protein
MLLFAVSGSIDCFYFADLSGIAKPILLIPPGSFTVVAGVIGRQWALFIHNTLPIFF